MNNFRNIYPLHSVIYICCGFSFYPQSYFEISPNDLLKCDRFYKYRLRWRGGRIL